MKSSKKRCKHLLKDLQQSAQFLVWLSDAVELFEPISEPANALLKASGELLVLCKVLPKDELLEAIADADAFNELCDLAETDFCSVLEDRMFHLVGNHENSPSGQFFQQLLKKLEHHQSELLDNIQLLIDLTHETDE